MYRSPLAPPDLPAVGVIIDQTQILHQHGKTPWVIKDIILPAFNFEGDLSSVFCIIGGGCDVDQVHQSQTTLKEVLKHSGEELGEMGIFMLRPEYCVQFRGEGYDGMSEYTKVEMRLGLLCRPDLNSSTRCRIPYYYGSESSSLYTCNTS